MNEPFKSGIPARLHAAALGFGGGSQEIDSLIGRDLLKVMPAAVKRCEHVTTDLDVYMNRGSCNVTCSYNLQRIHPPDAN